MDPGGKGGLAVIKGGHAGTVPMPATWRDVWEWFDGWSPVRARPAFTDSPPPVFAVVEKVGGYVKGSGGNIGSAMFKFGASYGSLLMALTAAQIPFEEVTPGVWQRAMGVKPRGKDEPKLRFKARLKQKAQQLFPGVRVTLATCDALLIAEFCRRKREGRL